MTRYSVMENTMPKESFYPSDARDHEDPRRFEVRWGDQQPAVTVGGVELEWSGLNRLIRVLRTARDATYGKAE